MIASFAFCCQISKTGKFSALPKSFLERWLKNMSGNLLLSTYFETVPAERTFPLHDFLGLNLSLQDSKRAP